MNDITTDAAKRPTLLTVLCILSFIWIGLMVIGGGLGYVGMKMFASGQMEEMLQQAGGDDATKSLEEMQAKVDESGMTAEQLATQMLILVAVSLVSLVGVIMMWKLRRPGFYIYALCALIGIAMPLVMGGKFDTSGGSIFGLVMTLGFVGLYFSQLKHMH
jgi:hypothetical protein